MQSLFRRRSAAPVVEATSDTGVATALSGATPVPGAEPAPTRPKGYTPSKKELGKATPKRGAAGRQAEPPPANRREAMRRARAKQRQARAEARAGMMAGKEEYLLARDKGPERALIRNIVDSRRNLATYFMPMALIVVIGSSPSMPAFLRIGANVLWITVGLGVVLDSVLLVRKINKALATRFPKSARVRGNGFYAIMRSMSFRRLRMPAPQVKLGEQV